MDESSTGLFSAGRSLPVLLGLLVLCGLLVWPVGEFPLNDAWSYARSVRIFMEEGRFVLGQFAVAALVFQIFWGGVLAKCFGFSFLLLRLATQVWSFAGLAVFYLILRRLEVDRKRAFCGVLLCLFNPVYFNLSYTFMTEIPFQTLTLLAIFFFLKAERGGGAAPCLWSGVCAGLAVLVRQTAALLPAAMLLALFWSGRWRGFSKRRAACLIIPPLAAAAGVHFWTMKFHAASSQFFKRWEQLGDVGPGPTADNVLGVLFYVGFFLLPLVCGSLWERRRETRDFIRGRKRLFVFFSALILAGILNFWIKFADRWGPAAVWQPLMPYASNVFYDFGLGPMTLPDVYVVDRPFAGAWGAGFRAALTAAAGLGVFGLLALLAAHWGQLKEACRKPGPAVFAFYALLYAGFLLVTSHSKNGLFDRYLMIFVAPVSAVLLAAGLKLHGRAFGSALAVFALFCVLGTQDYFSWNRARWDLCRVLMEDYRVHPSKIMAGFEFYSYMGPNDFGSMQGAPELGYVPSAERSKDRFVVTYAPVKAGKVLAELPFFSLIRPGRPRLYLSVLEDGIERRR
ncbi:MAG: glycosyltransferase family 39 protein [Elusimicrobia bacterium]|nr:glycosyltransferase family 39 protein [Elusimicrobiota bacterium]